jgi:undecaprenyl-diphosphatase
VSISLARLRAALSPGGYFAVQMAVGVMAFAAAAWLFGDIAEDVVTADPTVVFDRQVGRWFHAHQIPWLNEFSSGISQLFGGPAVTGATVLLLLYVLWRREWRWMITVICVVPGGMLVNGILKVAFHRARPTLSTLTAVLHTYSFPSGHVMAATLVCGVAAAYLTARPASWGRKVLTGLAACCVVVVVAFCRLYLGVHYLSDVLSAAAAGVMWLSLCLVAVGTLQHRRNGHDKGSVGD